MRELHRRVDIIVAPRSQYAFALLGWSGSKRFERSLREYSKKECGVHLGSHGMMPIATEEWIVANNEKDIFKYLNLEFIDPKYRNC